MHNNHPILYFEMIMLSATSCDHLSILCAMQAGNFTSQRPDTDDMLHMLLLLCSCVMYYSGGLM
jgi:hypothetical protein